MAETVAFLVQRGIPVMGHVGLTPQAVNVLGGLRRRGRGPRPRPSKILGDARALDERRRLRDGDRGRARADRDRRSPRPSPRPTIGIGASAQCDGQVLVTEDMLGMFERVPRFVKRYEEISTSNT